MASLALSGGIVQVPLGSSHCSNVFVAAKMSLVSKDAATWAALSPAAAKMAAQQLAADVIAEATGNVATAIAETRPSTDSLGQR